MRLGDRIEDLLRLVGAKWLVKKLYKDKDCGCDRRKEWLNKIKLW